MADSAVWLTSQGLHNVLYDVHRSDFTFSVVGRSFECPSFIAEFISPTVSRLRRLDPTLAEFVIEIDDPSGSLFFEKILSLARGCPLDITELPLKDVGRICHQLGNQELLKSILSSIHSVLTCDNVVDVLQVLAAGEMNREDELDFAASHFYELQGHHLDKLSEIQSDLLYEILSRPSLTIPSEDCLWDFISNELTDFQLLEVIQFEYLSPKSMNEVCKTIASSLSHLTKPIWDNLCRRLVLSVTTTERSRHLLALRMPLDKDPLSGIIGYLGRKHGTGLNKNGIVTVTIRDFPSNDSPCLDRVLDLTSETQIWTHWGRDNQWVCWDFKTVRIRPEHYTIRSEPHDSHLRQWVVEGSTDGSRWTILDERQNNTDLSQKLAIVTFKITHPEEVRMIRVRQTGLNHNGTHCLAISAFEVFGDVIEL
jgi:hypothetical protein